MDNANASPGQSDLQKRPRPVLSCLECRRKKLRCDRLLPCQQCHKSGRTALCAYSGGAEPGSALNKESENGDREPKRVRRTSVVESQDGRELEMGQRVRSNSAKRSGVVEELQERVARLEKAAGIGGKSHGRYLSEDDGVLPSHANGPINGVAKPSSTMSRYRAHRKRMTLLSQFDDARNFMIKAQQNGNDGMATIMSDLQTLNNVTKPRKRDHRQHALSIDVTCKAMIELLPNQSICDRLVELYFDNYENCLRILHKPSFLLEYRSFWDSWAKTGSATFSAFVPRLVAVLSVSSSLNVIPECGQVALDGDAFQPSAFELVERWIESVPWKQRYTLPILQLRLLTLLPQRGRSAAIEELWNLSGQVVRHAMAMNLHREPPESTTIYEAEMRRRLMMTVLENDLTMSLMCGMPAMLSPDDFTTRCPVNVNDSELYEEMLELPTPRPFSDWTDSLCQCVLAQSLPQRMSAYRYMSNIKSEMDYDEVLKHAGSLERLLQELPAPLRFNHVSDNASNNPGRLFARLTLDIFIRRVLLNLYTPFAFAIPANDAFREARVSYVQSCLVLLCYQDLYDPKFSEIEITQPEGYWDAFYKLYKHDIVQTCLGICIEIKRLTMMSNSTYGSRPSINEPVPAQDRQSVTPSRVQPWTKASLIKAVNDTIEPMIRRITRPGVDTKDLLCLVVVLHSVRTNQPPDQKEVLIRDGVVDLIQACRRQLQRDGVAISSTTATPSSERYDGVLNVPFGFTGLDMVNFDFSMASFPDMSLDANFSYTEPIGWGYA